MRNRFATVLAAASIGLGGHLHLTVWQRGYRHAPPRELFLLNVGLSAAIAAALLVRSGRITALAGLLVSAGSLAAFALSRGPGLPTLHGRFTEVGLAPAGDRFLGVPSALALLVLEGLAVACCLFVLCAHTRRSVGVPA